MKDIKTEVEKGRAGLICNLALATTEAERRSEVVTNGVEEAQIELKEELGIYRDQALQFHQETILLLHGRCNSEHITERRQTQTPKTRTRRDNKKIKTPRVNKIVSQHWEGDVRQPMDEQTNGGPTTTTSLREQVGMIPQGNRTE